MGHRDPLRASLTPESFQLDDQTPTLTLEARHSKHRKQDVLPLHPQLVDLLQQWLPEYPPGEPLFPKPGKRKAYMMIRKDLEAVGASVIDNNIRQASDDAPLWECLRSEACGEPCHLPSSAGNTVTMELATVNDENPCCDRGLDAVCPPVALDGTDGEKWRRRESNPRVHSRSSQVARRFWNMLQDVGVSWEWTDDANRQPMALEHEELAEVITSWPMLSADLRQAIPGDCSLGGRGGRSFACRD